MMAISLLLYLYSMASMNINQGCPGVEIVPREMWGARPSKENDNMTMPVHHVFIHHTAGLECDDLATCSKVMRGIQNFHMDDRGWDDIGYNFLIGGDGRVYAGRGWIRVGAHTYGYNRIAVAFSLMGNFQDKEPPVIMLDTAKKMIQCSQDLGYVTDIQLHGHRDAGCTLCPGQKLYDIIKTWPHFVGGPLPGWRCWSKEVQGCAEVEIVPRDKWGARPSRSNATMKMPVNHVFIHHTEGRQCADSETCSAIMRGIQDFHMDDRGWDDIGYNFLIGGDGRVYEGRGWTRVGAHTYGYNTISVAFSFIGNYKIITPPAIMIDKAIKLTYCSQLQGYVTDIQIHGHRDAGCTDCPGQKLYDIIKTWPHFIGGPLPGWRCKTKQTYCKVSSTAR